MNVICPVLIASDLFGQEGNRYRGSSYVEGGYDAIVQQVLGEASDERGDHVDKGNLAVEHALG